MNKEINNILELYKTNLQNQQTSTAVYNTLLTAIIQNMLPQNFRIKDEVIAKLLNVSRTPVREALSILRERGLIVSNTANGDIVRSYSLQEANDISEYAKTLRCEAAYLAALHVREKDLDRIEQACLTQKWINQKKAENDSTSIYIKYIAFHELIAKMTLNPYLISESVRVNEKLLMMHFCYPPSIKYEFTGNNYAKQHHELFLALKAQAPEAASNAVKNYSTYNVTKHMYILNNDFE